MKIRMYREIKPEEIKLHKTLGYMYFLDGKHPFASGIPNFVYYHRHVASIKLGRWVLPDEEVHHKDRNKQNNEPDNLEVLSSHEHKLKHGFLEHIECSHCKLVFKPVSRYTK